MSASLNTADCHCTVTYPPRTETASQKPLSRSLWNNLPHNVTSEEPLQVEKRTNPEGNKWACGC